MSELYWNKTVPELNVQDFERSLRFYTNVLGFDVRFRRENPDFAYLELGEVQLMLEALHPDAWITATPEAPFGRGLNIQMEVDDLGPILERLRLERVALFRKPHESWYAVGETQEEGQIEFLVQDPDGYLLRFVQALGSRFRAGV